MQQTGGTQSVERPETEPTVERGQDVNVDAVSMILKQAGRTADEVASLSALDDADRSAESQFSGEAPTLTSLFGKANVAEFYAGRFSPSAEVAKVMGDSMEFLIKLKKEGTLLDHEKMLFRDETITGLAELGFFGLAIPKEYGGSGAKLGDLGPLLRALTFIHPDLESCSRSTTSWDRLRQFWISGPKNRNSTICRRWPRANCSVRLL